MLFVSGGLVEPCKELAVNNDSYLSPLRTAALAIWMPPTRRRLPLASRQLARPRRLPVSQLLRSPTQIQAMRISSSSKAGVILRTDPQRRSRRTQPARYAAGDRSCRIDTGDNLGAASLNSTGQTLRLPGSRWLSLGHLLDEDIDGSEVAIDDYIANMLAHEGTYQSNLNRRDLGGFEDDIELGGSSEVESEPGYMNESREPSVQANEQADEDDAGQQQGYTSNEDVVESTPGGYGRRAVGPASR